MALISVSNNALSNISALPASIPTGSLTLISTQTASASASIEFTSGINSTYDSYVFKFIDIHPATDLADFSFNMSTDGGSNYNVVKTTTYFQSYHDEADTSAGLIYMTALDLAQSTSDQIINRDIGNASDENCCGTLQLFNPSSSTYVKHFIARTNRLDGGAYSIDTFVAGYANTQSPIDAVIFRFNLGNFDGIIKMYGVK